MPTMRPMWVEFPSDPKTYDMQHEYMVGPSLLVRPVTAQGATSALVYFPASHTPWYDVADGTEHAAGAEVSVSAPIEKIPVFQRGGTILPRQMRLRRSSSAMGNDPYTLVVAPDLRGAAEGKLFLDSGDGYAYRNGDFAYRSYSFAADTLMSHSLHSSASYIANNVLERVEIIGRSEWLKSIKSVRLTVGKAVSELGFHHADETRRLVVRKPGVLMDSDWSIELVSGTAAA